MIPYKIAAGRILSHAVPPGWTKNESGSYSGCSREIPVMASSPWIDWPLHDRFASPCDIPGEFHVDAVAAVLPNFSHVREPQSDPDVIQIRNATVLDWPDAKRAVVANLTIANEIDALYEARKLSTLGAQMRRGLLRTGGSRSVPFFDAAERALAAYPGALHDFCAGLDSDVGRHVADWRANMEKIASKVRDAVRLDLGLNPNSTRAHAP